MNSNSLAGRLAIKAPSAAELMGVDDLSKFDGEFLPSGWWSTNPSLLRFWADALNLEDDVDVRCAT